MTRRRYKILKRKTLKLTLILKILIESAQTTDIVLGSTEPAFYKDSFTRAPIKIMNIDIRNAVRFSQ
jgi:hypothetical protein